MAYFPIFTDISEKKCIIVGGGKVALRKVETLLRYEANVVVIAPDICPEIQKLLPEQALNFRSAREEDFRGAILAVAASSSRDANHRVQIWCKEQGVPVNVVDAPQECSFLFPAVVKRGDISIGINTGGKSPVLSSRIREDIEKVVPAYYADIARQLGNLRNWLKEHVPEEKERRRILKTAAAQAFVKESPLEETEIKTIIEG